MDKKSIRNTILYIAYHNSDKNQNIPINLLYNNDCSDSVPLENLIEDFNLDELDVVEFIIDLENIFEIDLSIDDFYRLETLGNLVNIVCDKHTN